MKMELHSTSLILCGVIWKLQIGQSNHRSCSYTQFFFNTCFSTSVLLSSWFYREQRNGQGLLAPKHAFLYRCQHKIAEQASLFCGCPNILHYTTESDCIPLKIVCPKHILIARKFVQPTLLRQKSQERRKRY